MGDLYFNNLNIESNKLSYCVDMLRLSCKMSALDYANLIKPFSIEPCFSMYEKSAINEFKMNHNYKGVDCSFWFGYMPNSEFYNNSVSISNPKALHNFTIEFNPNKCQDNKYLIYILEHMFDIKLVSVDFACDLPFSITDLDFIPVNKSFKHILDTPNGRTYYFGKGDKRIKIYDKTKESNLDYDLTRIEISVKVDKPFKELKTVDLSSLVFPLVSSSEYQLDFSDTNLDSTLKAILFACDNGFPVSYLSRRYQQKVKDYKIKKSSIEICPSLFYKTLINYLDYYFNVINIYNI